MKKLLLIILSLLISAGVAGCSVVPDNGNNGGGVNPPSTVDPPDEPITPPEDDGKPFTVTLWEVDTDKPFPIYEYDGTTALWTSLDDGSVTEVPFTREGVAQADELDGDYTVSVLNLPDGYVYNPNVCTANNENKQITVPVYSLSKYTGVGDGWYERVINFPKTDAIYRITIESASQKVYCQYAPPVTGEYYIETWADVTANEINPRIDVHNANKGWVEEDKVMESVNYTDDAACSVFTKNLKYRIGAYASTFVCAFELMCDSRVGYPVDVDICIARDSDYDFGEEQEYELYIPTEEFKYTPNYSVPFTYLAQDEPNGVLNGDRVAFNSTDGYYHMVEDGVMTDTILYAKIKGMITSPNGSEVIDFQTMETTDDTGVTTRGVNLYIGSLNYTFMIQGYAGLLNTNYSDAEKYKDAKSYINYVNIDGVYAVTKELKDFLQAFSKQNAYFYDGYGTAEGAGYNSTDANQWLFACGYYKE